MDYKVFSMVILSKRILTFILFFTASLIVEANVLVKDIARIKGVRTNSLIGYGLVTGLAGTGDSVRSAATIKSLSSTLQRFGLRVDDNEIRSRNVAAVTLTAKLPPYAQEGDLLDVNVTSIGDARSLSGGTLLMSELKGPNEVTYALAQGSLIVGGYQHELNGNVLQKNHPTSAVVSNGATIEKDFLSEIVTDDNKVTLVLRNPDMSTAFQISDAINSRFKGITSVPTNPANIEVELDNLNDGEQLRIIMQIEQLKVRPSSYAKVVINEKTGTVVYGGNVLLSAVSITHGGMKINIEDQTRVYLPNSLINDNGEAVVIPNSQVTVDEADFGQASISEGSSVTDLVMALNKLNASTQDVISILDAIKSAGAMHAEVIVQ